MHLEESKQILRECPLFSELNEAQLDLVLLTCEEANFMPGEAIFMQGDPGDALYIVVRGEVEILLESPKPGEEPVSLSLMTTGQNFGEVTLVEEGTRTATARARTAVQLIRIPRQRLLRLSGNYPEIGFHIVRRIAADMALKIRDMNLSVRTQIFWQPSPRKSDPQPI